MSDILFTCDACGCNFDQEFDHYCPRSYKQWHALKELYATTGDWKHGDASQNTLDMAITKAYTTYDRWNRSEERVKIKKLTNEIHARRVFQDLSE